jgi:hypothetical protein
MRASWCLLVLALGCTKSAPVGITEEEARAKLTACTFGAGALAKDTLHTRAKVGT